MKWITSLAGFQAIVLWIIWMIIGVFGLLGSALGQTKADCPQTLSVIDKGVLSPLVSQTLKEIYHELGCRVRFVPLPGRRGIASFNKKQVNGEVMRLEKAEIAYRRGFVRSSVPLLVLSSSLWQHPNQLKTGDFPVGYTLGIVWQEDFIKDKRGRKFNNATELFAAYNAGELSGFLSADTTVKMLVDSGQVIPKPSKIKTIVTAPLYHYLGEEFKPFMLRFSALLKAEDPFADIIDF